MALKDEFESLENQIERLESIVASLSVKLSDSIKSQFADLDQLSAKTADQYRKDLSANAKFLEKSLEKQKQLRERVTQSRGKDTKAVKEIQELEEKVRRKKEASIRIANNLTKEGIYLNQEELLELEGVADEIIGISDGTKNLQKELTENNGLLSVGRDVMKSFANKIDESGTLAKLLSGELDESQRNAILAQAGFAVLVASMFEGSKLISSIRKETGLSSEASRRFQLELAEVALNSEKIFITSKRLNASFLELTKQTGLIADFGGDTLETQTTLTHLLKLSAEQAGKLSILSRIQSKDTEGVLENTVNTVSALSQQEKVGFNVRGILEEIASVSDAIAVSLGKNPVEIAKAVTQAKLLGLSLSEVDAIASSLLDFESSITNELQAELLIGKDLNLERARLLALNNDLAGLGEELRNQEEIRLAFATGNRIQQEAASKAIGISRDQLAKIVLQQDLISLGAERFVAAYGEATYQSIQSQSASEKFADTLEKIKGVLGDIGTAFAPILDGIASFTAWLAKSKGGVIALAGVFSGLLALSVAKAIADAIVAFTIAFGPAGVPLGIAAGAAILGAVGTGLAIADDMIAPAGYGDRILSTPKGSIALNNQDTIVAGTNLGGDNREIKETNSLLRQILQKQGTVQIDSVQAGTAFAMNTYQVQ